MKITDLFQGIGNPIAFYPDLVPLTGSHQSSILLCQLCYWSGKQNNPEGWIYKTQEEWEIETDLSPKEQRTARRMLCDRGLIEERFVGMPRRLEYRIDTQKINFLWDWWTDAIRAKYLLKDKLKEQGFLASRKIADPLLDKDISELRKAWDTAKQLTVKPETIGKSIHDWWEQQQVTVGHLLPLPVVTTVSDQPSHTSIYTEITSEITSKITATPPEPGEPPTQDTKKEEESAINEEIENFVNQQIAQSEDHPLPVKEEQDTEHPAIPSSGSQVSADASAPQANSKQANSEQITDEQTKNLQSANVIEWYFDKLEKMPSVTPDDIVPRAIIQAMQMQGIVFPWKRNRRVNDQYQFYLPEFVDYKAKAWAQSKGDASSWKSLVVPTIRAIKNDEKTVRGMESLISEWFLYDQEQSTPKPIAVPLESLPSLEPVVALTDEEKERSRQLVSERIAAAKQKAQLSKKAPTVKIDQEKQNRLASVEAVFNLGV
ncbi:MAG: hypothetical protein KatS3mg087_0523 [Patescibacteria group bacterium]|nr:MAG: hypothetical protein KatS3mg087_0523 [Patescibacteria group bacterium]